MGHNFIALSNWNCGRRSIYDRKCGFSSIYWAAEQISACLSEGDRAKLLNKGMDEQKKLRNKQTPLQGEEEQLEDPIANMKRMNCISETKNEILDMDSIIIDDPTIVAENDPTGNSEEREQSSDRRLDSLHNKLEDLPLDEIFIRESSITGKETQMLIDDDNNLTEVQDHTPNVEHPEKLPVQELMDLEEQSGMKMKKPSFDEEGIEEIEVAKTKSIASLDAAETFSTSCSEMNLKKDDVFLHGGSNYAQELLDTQGTSKRTMRCKRPVKDSEEVRKFNPREPNYLPVEPETE
ncbi:hypothetical protein Ancab_000367 [Ancistrocladus abbreviatus]